MHRIAGGGRFYRNASLQRRCGCAFAVRGRSSRRCEDRASSVRRFRRRSFIGSRAFPAVKASAFRQTSLRYAPRVRTAPPRPAVRHSYSVNAGFAESAATERSGFLRSAMNAFRAGARTEFVCFMRYDAGFSCGTTAPCAVSEPHSALAGKIRFCRRRTKKAVGKG